MFNYFLFIIIINIIILFPVSNWRNKVDILLYRIRFDLQFVDEVHAWAVWTGILRLTIFLC